MKSFFKKGLATALCLACVVSMCACGNSAGDPSADASGDSASGNSTKTATTNQIYPASEWDGTVKYPAAGTDGIYIGEDYGENLGDKTVKAGETWKVEDSCVVGHLEIEDGAMVEADYPVVVFFGASDTVGNGDVIGNVQFICDYDEVVAIVHTNDTHGFLQNEPAVKGLSDQLKASGNYSLVLTVNAGDEYAGGYAAAHIYEGEYIPYIMSDIYDYMTWGNNDAGISDKGLGTYFLAALGNETGVTTLLANQAASEDIDLAAYAAEYEPAVGAEEFVDLYSDILSLNDDGTIDYSAMNLEKYALASGDAALDDTAIVTTDNGTKIGLWGVSTQGGSITDAYFGGGQSTLAVAQEMTDRLRSEGATVVVGIGHIGWMGPDSKETSSNDTNSAKVCLYTDGLDALVDGHTHSVINDGEGYLFSASGDAIVNQASCKGEAIGVMYLFIKDGKVLAKDCENLVPNEDGEVEGVVFDSDIQAKVDRCYGKLDEDGYTAVAATSPYFLNGERISTGDVGGGVRANETNLGDLVADGIVYTANALYDDAEITVALYPGFWVRSSIEAGDITMIDALSVFANPLKIYHIEYTAEELVEQMNKSVAKIGEENNNMFQVSGLTCVYDAATKTVYSLTVGDTLIYENGEYKVGSDWTVHVAAEVGGGDMTIPDGGTELVESNTKMAEYWVEFLKNGEYTIYENVPCPDGRVVAK